MFDYFLTYTSAFILQTLFGFYTYLVAYFKDFVFRLFICFLYQKQLRLNDPHEVCGQVSYQREPRHAVHRLADVVHARSVGRRARLQTRSPVRRGRWAGARRHLGVLQLPLPAGPFMTFPRSVPLHVRPERTICYIITFKSLYRFIHINSYFSRSKTV